MSSRIRKWIPGMSVGLGFLMTLGLLGATPSPGALFSAARGLADAGQLGERSFFDIVLAAVWRAGGDSLVSVVIWLGSWLVWGFVFFVLIGVGALIAERWRRMRWVVTALLGGLLIFLCGSSLWSFLWNWDSARRDLNLIVPAEVARLAADEGSRVFANPRAHSTLILFGVQPDTSPKDSAVLAATPSRWRAALREKGWTAVVLAGPSAEFQPLLDHLLTSPDWRLEKLTNLGWLFKREGGPSNPLPKPAEIDLGDPADTAIYLAQLSSQFDAMAKTGEARAAIERALELSPEEAIVRFYAAQFALQRQRWQDVVSHARGALRASSAFPQAHALAARGYFESGDFDSAEKSASAALAGFPSDLSTRFLLARIQRANRDFRSEAETLERLITDSQKAGLPTAGYLAYLGQSYAQVGNAVSAAKSYQEALDSGQLNDEQKQAVREALEIVELRSRWIDGSQESNGID